MLTQLRNVIEGTFDRERRWFGEDQCEIIGPVFTEGGATGDSVQLATIATYVDCFVREISGASAQVVIGGAAYISSHQIEVKSNSVTIAITPEYRIRVYARDGVPERIFENPVTTSASYAPLVEMKAQLVRQGFSR